MENKNIRKFGYDDTDKKIEIDIYGLIFEIRNFEKIERISKENTSNTTDLNVISEYIDEILGKGSIDKINEKRIEDGYEKSDLIVELNILGCIFEVYAETMSNSVLNRVTTTIEKTKSKIENYENNLNREQRRNYKNYNKYNRGYKDYNRGY